MRAPAIAHRLIRSCRGFSVVETLTALSAASMLTAVGGPALDSYLAQARITKAMNDGKVITLGLSRLAYDVSHSERVAHGFGTQDLLIGAGETPGVATGGDPRWAQPAAQEGSLTDHLVTNDAGYATTAGARVSAAGGWRGPYVDGPIGADPWGNRYAVNVRWLASSTGFDTIVLSAGPNGVIETSFEKNGLVAGGDDVVTLVSTGN